QRPTSRFRQPGSLIDGPRCLPRSSFAGGPAMASVEEIERKQKAMQPLLEQIAQEKYADRILQLGKQIAEMAQELGRMAQGLERAYAQAGGGTGETRVVLTKDQRQRVAAATGGSVEVS